MKVDEVVVTTIHGGSVGAEVVPAKDAAEYIARQRRTGAEVFATGLPVEDAPADAKPAEKPAEG